MKFDGARQADTPVKFSRDNNSRKSLLGLRPLPQSLEPKGALSCAQSHRSGPEFSAAPAGLLAAQLHRPATPSGESEFGHFGENSQPLLMQH